jgi:zinc D-Ala-D-Ala carboxypeptidase
VKYFTYSEFDSPDSIDSGSNMDESFLRMLDSAREAAGTPFRINSGFRTPKHNKKVGGSENSSHLRGFAADIHVASNSTRYVILEALLNVGFNRIGIADTFIHVDADPIKTKNVIWTYA